MEVKNLLFLGGAKRVAMARTFKEAGARPRLKGNNLGYELARRGPLARRGGMLIRGGWNYPPI